jgi:hypothetical protein
MVESVAKIKGALSYALLTSMPASVTSSSRQGFDYTNLDAATSQFVQQQTGEIRALMRLSFESIVQIGQKLKTVKEQLGHGYFRDWLKAEFNWGAWTATKFMQVAERFEGTNYSHLDIAPSALYDLAAPSTPQAAREEALTRAASGESITHTTAKAIKQKYATPSTKLKAERISPQEPPSLPTPLTPTILPQSGSKLEIVAFRPQTKAPVLPEASNIIASPAQTLSAPRLEQPISPPDVPGVWWQLGGKHLLYCGDPNSAEFLRRVTEKVSLLLAFPLIPDWQPGIRAKARIIVDDYLPQGKKLDQLHENLESNVLFHSNLGEMVVSCFLPSPEILSLLNRHSRRALVAEPNSKRVAAVISDWKGAGLKVERLN